MQKCVACGTLVASGSLKCGRCGTAVPVDPTSAAGLSIAPWTTDAAPVDPTRVMPPPPVGAPLAPPPASFGRGPSSRYVPPPVTAAPSFGGHAVPYGAPGPPAAPMAPTYAPSAVPGVPVVAAVPMVPTVAVVPGIATASIYGTPVFVAEAQKSKAAAALLCFFFGWLGAHRFYTGQTGIGLTQLLLNVFLFWTIIVPLAVGVWVFVDFILILTGGVKDKYGRPLT